jgi:hypothetical protein
MRPCLFWVRKLLNTTARTRYCNGVMMFPIYQTLTNWFVSMRWWCYGLRFSTWSTLQSVSARNQICSNHHLIKPPYTLR